MDRKPNIIVTGMLDTKFNEIRFLADQVAVYGGNPVVMDLSLGQSADWADITREEVLKTAGVSEKEVSDAQHNPLLNRSSGGEGRIAGKRR